MAKRSSRSQRRQDRRVREIAETLRRQGWDVQADIPGYSRRDAIGKYNPTPDLRAARRGVEQLVEVETSATLHSHRKQHETFRRRAGQKARSTFHVQET